VIGRLLVKRNLPISRSDESGCNSFCCDGFPIWPVRAALEFQREHGELITGLTCCKSLSFLKDAVAKFERAKVRIESPYVALLVESDSFRFRKWAKREFFNE